MELLARLEHIELKIAQIKERNKELLSENEQLKNENLELKNKLEDAAQKLKNLEETNKMIKLAKGMSADKAETRELKIKINQLIRDIDRCIDLLND